MSRTQDYSLKRAGLILLLVCWSTVSAQVSHTIRFETGKLRAKKITASDGNSYDALSYDGLQQSREIGKPDLPIKLVRLLIPTNQDVQSISVKELSTQPLPGSFRVLPVQPPVPTGKGMGSVAITSGDSSIYGSDEYYPATSVCMIHGDYLDDNHVVTLAVYPVQYSPGIGKARFTSTLEFTLDLVPRSSEIPGPLTGSRLAEDQTIYDHLLTSLIENRTSAPPLSKPGSYSGNMLSTVRGIPTYNYVIITSDALSSEFNSLVAWKKRKGFVAGVVTTSQIFSAYTGDEISGINDNAGKIRQYLAEAHQLGSPSTTWVLLAGDQSIIPVRYGAGSYNCDWSDTSEFRIPADLYFADFTGDWDVDHDVQLGENYGDSPDYWPEVFLGRIPCTSQQDARNWIKKALSYECNPGQGNGAYLARAFWIQGPNLPDDPVVTANMLPSTIANTVWYRGDAQLVVAEMSNQYGLSNFYCHGQPTEVPPIPWTRA